MFDFLQELCGLEWVDLGEYEYDEVMIDPDPGRFCVRAALDRNRVSVILRMGDNSHLWIPFEEFKVCGNGMEPDFDDMKIVDFGQTLRLGNYEAAVDHLITLSRAELR